MTIKTTLLELRDKIWGLEKRGTLESLNETETRRLLIDPLIEAIGYDLNDLEQARLGWRGGKSSGDQKEADYALFRIGDKKPCLIVEAKRLSNLLDDERDINQALTYTYLNGVEWCMITNGDRVLAYDAFSRDGGKRFLFEFYISCIDIDPEDIDPENDVPIDSDRAAYLISLLSPESLESGQITEFRDLEILTGDVFEQLSKLITNSDDSLVRILRKNLGDKYSPSEIRQALEQIEVRKKHSEAEFTDITPSPRITVETGELKRKSRPSNNEKEWSRLNTIVCPAQDEGFEEVFLGENRWYAIRLRKDRIPHIKYIAMYRVAPISAVTHYGEVESIEPCNYPDYKGQGKYIVNLKGKPKEIKPIKLESPPQSTVYFAFKDLVK